MAQVKLYDYELEHMEKLRKLAPECMVLLKSDGSFPLSKPEKITLIQLQRKSRNNAIQMKSLNMNIGIMSVDILVIGLKL